MIKIIERFVLRPIFVILFFILQGAMLLLEHWLKVVATLSLIFGLTISYELAMFRVEFEDFRGSVVFDIDKVRSKMAEEMGYMYYQGCRDGTEYPEDFRVVTGFNVNSPMSWCTDKRDKEWMEYIYTEVGRVGKKGSL